MRQRWSLYNDKVGNSSRRYTIINTYTPNIRAPKRIKQTLKDPKGEIDNITIIIGNFSVLYFQQWLDQVDRKLTRKHWN